MNCLDEVSKMQLKKGRRLNVMKLFGRRAAKSPRLGLLFGRDVDYLCANGRLCQPVMVNIAAHTNWSHLKSIYGFTYMLAAVSM